MTFHQRPERSNPVDAFDHNALHVMTFTAADAGSALAAVQDELATAGATLSGLTLSAFDQIVEGVIRLTDISCETARACSDRLAARPGVFGARVEHHLFRP